MQIHLTPPPQRGGGIKGQDERGRQHVSARLRGAVSDRQSAGLGAGVPQPDAWLRAGDAAHAGGTHRGQRLPVADGLAVRRLAHPGLFRHHVADRAHRRRLRGQRDGVAAVARGRGGSRGEAGRDRGRAVRRAADGVLSADHAAHGRAGLDRDRDHDRQPAPDRRRHARKPGAARRRRGRRDAGARGDDLSVVPLRRDDRADRRQERHQRADPALGLHPAVHRLPEPEQIAPRLRRRCRRPSARRRAGWRRRRSRAGCCRRSGPSSRCRAGRR